MEVRREGPRPVVAVAGELDMVGGQLLDAVISHVRTTDPGPVAVDLADVTFVDSHGLAPALERDVVLVAASPKVSRLMRLLGLSSRDRKRAGRPPAAAG
jgi:anti-anti-sigma factor